MLPRFSNEVLSRGPHAILPQNLSDYWLGILQKRCDDFLDANFAVDECAASVDAGDSLLIACIYQAVQYRSPDTSDLPADEVAENATIFALSITMESIRRTADLDMPLPTLENLLSIDRIIAFGKTNPEFGRFLEQACIIPHNGPAKEDNWLQRLKKKILDRIDTAG